MLTLISSVKFSDCVTRRRIECIGHEEGVPIEGSLCARTAWAFAKEGLRLWSCKIDRNNYSSDRSDNSADETYLPAVDDLSYSESYRDDVDYDARHPSPSCPRKESGT